MEYRVLKYFLTVAKCNNITRAAEELHLTQPTLSRQLAELEHELGTALFVRGKRKTTLTEAGMFLRSRAEEILALTDKTVEQFEQLDQQVAGDVYIGCGETMAMSEILSALSELHQQYPAIRINLQSGNQAMIVDNLQKGLLDFGVLCRRTAPIEYNYLKAKHTDRWGLIMLKSNPLAAKDAIRSEDLSKEPVIISKQVINSGDLDYWLGGKSKLNITATYSLLYNAVFLLEQGFGSIVSLDGIIKLDSPSMQHLVFRPLEPAVQSSTFVIWRKEQVFSQAGRLVAEALSAALRQNE